MGVIFMDGFDAGDFAMKWNDVLYSATSVTTRYSSGKSLSFTNSLGYVQRGIDASSVIYVGLAVYARNTLDANGGSSAIISLMVDAGTAFHLTLRPASSSTMGLFRGTSTLLGSFPFTARVWRYLELYATIHDTAGEYEVRADGITVLSATNVDTKNAVAATVDAVRIGGASGSDFILDDFYVSDSAFLGEITIQTLVPTAAGSSTQLAPTGGANYANVADMPDSTATYNASSTVGNKDLYALGDLAAGTASVKCIQVNTHSWKDDAGVASLKTKIKSGATEVSGTTTSLPSSVAWTGDVWETDPNTSTAWTVSGVNALEAGAEVA